MRKIRPSGFSPYPERDPLLWVVLAVVVGCLLLLIWQRAETESAKTKLRDAQREVDRQTERVRGALKARE